MFLLVNTFSKKNLYSLTFESKLLSARYYQQLMTFESKLLSAIVSRFSDRDGSDHLQDLALFSE
jgi:hypothetical protein